MLEVAGLACSRGERRLFSDVGFTLAPGDCLHVRGENGAGKTSLMRVLVGLSPADAGEIRWRQHAAPSSDFHRDLIYMGHHAAVKEELTPLENLRFSAALDGADLGEMAALKALIRLGLRGREDLPVRVLSQGQKRRVLLARLLTRKATLWVLDEAFNALDAPAVELLGQLISEHLGHGGIAILTSHQPLPLAVSQVLSL